MILTILKRKRNNKKRRKGKENLDKKRLNLVMRILFRIGKTCTI